MRFFENKKQYEIKLFFLFFFVILKYMFGNNCNFNNGIAPNVFISPDVQRQMIQQQQQMMQQQNNNK